jgi:hypothetical protein
MARQPLVGQGLLLVQALRSHSDTPHSVGLLLTRDIHVPGGIQSRNPSKRAAADPHLRPCGHWDRHCWRGCKHEQKPWTKTDIPFEGLENQLLFSWTKTDMILKPSTGSGRKFTSPTLQILFVSHIHYFISLLLHDCVGNVIGVIKTEFVQGHTVNVLCY